MSHTSVSIVSVYAGMVLTHLWLAAAGWKTMPQAADHIFWVSSGILQGVLAMWLAKRMKQETPNDPA